MELIFKDYNYNNELITFTISSNKITGITGTDKEKLLDIIINPQNYKNHIFINDKELTKDNIKTYKKKVIVLEEKLQTLNYIENVYQLMLYQISNKNLSLKNADKKITDSLKIVGLNASLLERNINTLSTSEKKLLTLAVSLISNPEIIIIKEPFKDYDLKTEKKIMLLFQKIKEQYQKTIVFMSDDSNMLYKYTDELLIFHKDKLIITGETKELYQRVDFLKRNKIFIPEIVEITYLAKKKKKVKIDYHKDIRDIIKDIYKHV